MYFLIFTFSDGGGRQSIGFYNENIAVTYWVDQKVHLGFSTTSDEKTWVNFLANPT